MGWGHMQMFKEVLCILFVETLPAILSKACVDVDMASRDSNGISKLSLLKLNLYGKISCIRGSLEIPLPSLIWDVIAGEKIAEVSDF